jgi:vesicle-fusing ATPase
LEQVPNTGNISLLSNEEELRWQEEEEESKSKERIMEKARDNNVSSKEHKSKLADSLPEIQPLPGELDLDLKQSPLMPQQPLVSQLSFDFTRCGIGGNKDALRELVSQVFYSRALGQHAKNYGAKPVKGVLLYGPPGTGKTSIARAIAGFFPESQVEYVKGPELMNKYVGESEYALRKLFFQAQSAWQLYKETSPLYVIICDEVDACFPKRGSRNSGTGVDDKMTSQMLSLMDGLNDIGTVLVIGTTNRPELLDDALKRENRFSLLLEIGLPDTATRKEILELKIQQLRSSNLLEEEINFQSWAEKTAGFSGADLEQFVRTAKNYAQTRNFDYDNETNTLKLKQCVIKDNILEVVTKADFEQAYLKIKPANRMDKTEFNFNRHHFVIYNDNLESIIDNYQLCIKQLCRPYSNRMSYLLAGKTGTGKTNLAKYLAESSNFDSIKLITPEHILGKPIQVQLDILEDCFRQAMRIDKCVIILDNLEGILSSTKMH